MRAPALLLVLASVLVATGVPASAASERDVSQCLQDCIKWLVENQFTEQDVGKSWTFEDPGGTYQGARYAVHFATEENGQLKDQGPAKEVLRVEQYDVGVWPATFKGDNRIIAVRASQCAFRDKYGLEAVQVGKYIAALVDRSKRVIYVKPSSKYPGVLFGGEPAYSSTKFAVPMLVLAVKEGVKDPAFKEAVKRAVKWVLTVNKPRGYYYQRSLAAIREKLEKEGNLTTSIGGALYYYVIPLLLGRELGIVDDDLWNQCKDHALYILRHAVLAPEVHWKTWAEYRNVLVIDAKGKLAYWLRQKRKEGEWVSYSRTYDTAAAVLALVHAIKLGLLKPDEEVQIGEVKVKVGDLVRYATNALVRFFVEGCGNPCYLEKQAVEQGVYWKSYYYPVKYSFYALWAIRDAREAGLLGDYARKHLSVALRRYVGWLEGMQLEGRPGYFPYNEYILGSPDFASTCAALLGLCMAVEMGHRSPTAIDLIKRVVDALISQYRDAKKRGLKYLFYVPTPESRYYLYMSRFFADRSVNEVAFATAHAVAALAAVEKLPADVKKQVLKGRKVPVAPVVMAAVALLLLRRRLPA